jgi:hypothetical protein
VQLLDRDLRRAPEQAFNGSTYVGTASESGANATTF